MPLQASRQPRHLQALLKRQQPMRRLIQQVEEADLRRPTFKFNIKFYFNSLVIIVTIITKNSAAVRNFIVVQSTRSLPVDKHR